MTKAMMNQLVAQVTEQVEAMKVAEMRKQASVFAIKNAKQYKREELAAKLIERMVAVEKSTIEAQEEADAKAAKDAEKQVKAEKATKKAKADATEKKATKKAAKKAEKAEGTEEKKDKRYKAEKVDEDAVDKLVEEIVGATPAEVEAMDLYNINRKVLIEVMKQLHCKLWYRTYDKPTMIAKITIALKKEDK